MSPQDTTSDRSYEDALKDQDFTRPPGDVAPVQPPGKLNEVTPPPKEILDQTQKILEDSAGASRSPSSVPPEEDPNSHWHINPQDEDKYWGDDSFSKAWNSRHIDAALNNALGAPTPEEQQVKPQLDNEEYPNIGQGNEAYPTTDPAYQQQPGGMQEPAQNNIPENLTNGIAESGIGPVGSWDSWAASLHRDFSDSTTANVLYFAAEQAQKLKSAMSGVQNITGEQANKLYPGMPEPFSKDIDPYIAAMQHNRFINQQKANDWAARGHESGFQSFMSSAAAGILDPINVAAMMVAGPEVEALSFKNVVAQNFLMGGANELIIAGQHKTDHLAPNFQEELSGWVEGSAEMSLLHVGLSKIFSEMKKRFPPDLLKEGIRETIANNEAGAPPPPPSGAVTMEAEARASGATTEDSSFKFNPVTHPSDRSWFQGIRSNGDSVEFSNLKGGTHYVDNEHVANHSAIDFADGHGKVGVKVMDEFQQKPPRMPLPDEFRVGLSAGLSPEKRAQIRANAELHMTKDGHHFWVSYIKDGTRNEVLAFDTHGNEIGSISLGNIDLAKHRPESLGSHVTDGSKMDYPDGTPDEERKSWRSRGVGTAMYDSVKRFFGADIAPSESLSNYSASLWRNRDPKAYLRMAHEQAARRIRALKRGGDTVGAWLSRDLLRGHEHVGILESDIQEAMARLDRGEKYNPPWADKTRGPEAESKYIRIPDEKSTNILHADEPLPPALLSQAEAEFRKAGMDGMVNLKDTPAEQVFQALDHLPLQDDGYDPMEVFKARAQAEGYDGVLSVARDENGKPLHNQLTLFKDDVEPDAHYDSSPDLFKKPMTDDEKVAALKAQQDPKANQDAGIASDIKAEKNKAPVDGTPEQMDPVIQETEQNAMAHLETLAKDNPSISHELDKLREELAAGKALAGQEQQAFKDFGDCVMGGSS